MNPLFSFVGGSATASWSPDALQAPAPIASPAAAPDGAAEALQSYTGVARDGRPELPADYVASARGHVAVNQLRRHWDHLIERMQLAPANVERLHETFRAALEPGRALAVAHRQGALLGHGQRALAELLWQLDRHEVYRPRQLRVTLDELARGLFQEDADIARCLSGALTGLCCKGSPFANQANLMRARIQVNALLEGLQDYFQQAGMSGASLKRRVVDQGQVLLQALGLHALTQDQWEVPIPDLPPEVIARVADGVDRAVTADAVAQRMATLGLERMREAVSSRGRSWSALDLSDLRDQRLVMDAWRAQVDLLGPVNLDALKRGPERPHQPLRLVDDPQRLVQSLRPLLLAEGYAPAPSAAAPAFTALNA